MSWQNRARAFPERDLTFNGRVTAPNDGVVALEVWEEDDTGAVLGPGHDPYTEADSFLDTLFRKLLAP